jgi:hypothetical protein
MKHKTKIIATYLIIMVMLVPLSTGGCMGQRKGEVDNNKSFPANYLKTGAITHSNSGTGNSAFAESSILPRNYV